jgi:protein SCO1
VRLSNSITRCCTTAASLAAGLLCIAAPGLAAREATVAVWPDAAVAPWRDDAGRTFDLESMRGHFTIVTMAYTHCRLICPMVFERLAQMQRELDSRGHSAEFVVIGFAGVEDDPAAWHHYRETRHLTRANWHFLSASEPVTQRFARAFGFEYWRYDEHVMHGFQIFVFGEDGNRRMQVGADDGPWHDPRT